MIDDAKKVKHDVVSLVNELLSRAVQSGASDVHFEPTRDAFRVRFRLDGVLQTIESLPAIIGENVIARLKVLGGLLTYRNDVPQEGRMQLDHPLEKTVMEQRLAIFPTIHGQRAVVRLFYSESQLDDLDELGLPELIREKLQGIVGQNQGVLLLTGPAGSGKSTTLAALLRDSLHRFPGKSIVALEDPVERHIEGVTQAQITPQGEMTFPVALRSLLRQDPEVLMIGEIRDAETARIVIEAGLTGHLLLSTLHSGSPAGALLRLLEMGIEPYQVTSSVQAVLNQRLLRKLCDQCKHRSGKVEFAGVQGCGACLHTGYNGRVLIAELVELDGELRQALLAKADLDQLDTLLNNRGHMTLQQSALQQLNQGATSQEEVDKIG